MRSRAIARKMERTLLADSGSRLETGSSARTIRLCWASARDRDPLLLPARQAVGPLQRLRQEADAVERGERQLPVLAREAPQHDAPGWHMAEAAGQHVVER